MDYMSPVECAACGGQRLKPASLAVRVKGIRHRGIDQPADRARAENGQRRGN